MVQCRTAWFVGPDEPAGGPTRRRRLERLQQVFVVSLLYLHLQLFGSVQDKRQRGVKPREPSIKEGEDKGCPDQL